MISYPCFDFASPPRTGTAWFVKACALAGLGERSRGSVHYVHNETSHQLRVTHLRHPCSWLASYYTTVKGTYLDVPSVDVFRNLDNRSFDRFVRSYLRQMPGAVGAMFASYRADCYLRLEDEPHAIVNLLKTCGVMGNTTKIIMQAPANRSAERLPIWSKRLYDKVVEAEATFIEEFEYGDSKYRHLSEIK